MKRVRDQRCGRWARAPNSPQPTDVRARADIPAPRRRWSRMGDPCGHASADPTPAASTTSAVCRRGSLAGAPGVPCTRLLRAVRGCGFRSAGSSPVDAALAEHDCFGGTRQRRGAALHTVGHCSLQGRQPISILSGSASGRRHAEGVEEHQRHQALRLPSEGWVNGDERIGLQLCDCEVLRIARRRQPCSRAIRHAVRRATRSPSNRISSSVVRS